MKFEVSRDTLLEPLGAIQGVIERRQTLPILANVLLRIENGRLTLTATDMEIELVSGTQVEAEGPGETTLPARKLMDICRTLQPDARVSISIENQKALVRSGRSRFTLSTLPASDFPATEAPSQDLTLTLPQLDLKQLIELTQFAMAQQDVRYYLNGLMLEIAPDYVRAVATDGHRLAAADLPMSTPVEGDVRQIIVPRKGVLEMTRLLGNEDKEASLTVGANAVRLQVGESQLTSKLIEGRFPDYERVIPTLEANEKQVVLDRDAFMGCLSSASVLSNDKYRAVRLSLAPSVLRVVANNPEQEEAEVELEVDYSGESLEIGFNVQYMIQALNVLPSDKTRLCLTDSSSSCLVLAEGRDDCRYVVMPMRL